MTTETYAGQEVEESRLYDGPERARHLARVKVCRDMLSRRPPSSVTLDLGGGDGYAASLVLPNDSRLYYSIDVALPKLVAVSAARRGSGIAGDLIHLPIASRAADLVLALEVLEHLDAPASALSEVHRVLRPDGALLVAVPVDSRLWRLLLRTVQIARARFSNRERPPREHVQVFTRRSFHRLITHAGFDVISSRCAVFALPLLGAFPPGRLAGRVVEGVLRHIPIDNFGFVRNGRSFAIGRQHLVIYAKRR